MSVIESTVTFSVVGWADRISESWRRSAEAVIETGRLLIAAKAELVHGEWLELIKDRLPFSASTAQRLMAIASDPKLSNPAHVQHLPQSWGTLYELTKLDEKDLEARVEDGTIRPDMERGDITTVIKQKRRAEREQSAALAVPEGKFGVILEDFEWDFETYSEAGRDRHAANHYPTSTDSHTAEEIVARTAERLTFAADDCVLFMWTTVPHVAIAFDVIKLRGFTYKSQFVWIKDRHGTGYWNKGLHEILLIAARGTVVAPAPGMQWFSAIDGEVRAHSQKPDWQYDLIDAYFPSARKLELNPGDDSEPRPGWTKYGRPHRKAEAAE